MPVHHLPPSSISSLTATQVLTHPPSLIKELIENAIDASSTLVSVELANNCLDFLQVKDNGHGILPGGDRECLCRRGWTSKISRWEEIEQWMGGGGTLGFRGEALAAAAEMAGGGVEVTTKVEGERVGWTGLYTRAGELARGSQSSKSAPIGTTVRVMGFLKNLPVRRETAVKSATKHLQQIRRILITYALSHPKIRFSLKVFPAGPKAKLPTDDYWVYSPSKTVQEAIMKIFGKELAGDGIWVEKSGGGGDGDGGVEVQAFLVKVGIDPSSLPSKSKAPSITGGMGFIFVDSRPISCSRPGPFKSLLSLYKNYIRSSLLTLNPDNPSPSTTLDPFIFLNIKCKSPGMYDPNIEPAKDDVLFRNWDGDVLGVVDIIFREVYGELVGKEKGEKEKVKRPQGVDGVDFGVLLAKKPALVTIAPVAEESAATAGVGKGREGSMVEKETDGFVDPELDLYDDATPLSGSHNLQATNTNSDSTPTATELPETSNPRPQRQRRPTWGFSMSTNLVDEDGLDDAGEEYLPPPPSPLGEEEATRKDVSLSNPWVMAKMNASMKDSLSPMRGAGASSLSVHSGGGGGSSSTSGGDGRGAGWARRGLPPAYRMTSTNRNRDAITAFNNGGNSPFPSGQSLGGLHKWISSGVASTSTPASGVVRKFVQQDHEGSSLPIASSTPARERRVDQIPVAGRVRGAAVVEGGFMTATEFMAVTGEDEEEHPQLGGGIGRGGTGFTPVNATSNYHQRFGGVDGPGGVVVRRRERAAHRARGEGNLWANRLERHPFSQSVSGQEESDESEEDRGDIGGSLGREGSPVVKRRRRMEMGKGKGKARESYSGGEDDNDDDVIPERDEQLDILFTQPPPQKSMVGQKKSVPPLLKPQGGEVVGVISNEVIGTSDVNDDMINNNAPQSPPQQLSTCSPHRNRQRTATAALGMAADTVVNNLARGSALPGPTTATAHTPEEESEQPQTKVTKKRARTKPRYLLPLERVAPEQRMHNIYITIHFSSGMEVVKRVAQEVGRLNLGEYTANPRKEGKYIRTEMRAEWVGEVVREWLRGKIGKDGGDWEKELVGRVKWGQRDGGGEGEEEVRKLVAVWE